jgi:hypothetical protein
MPETVKVLHGFTATNVLGDDIGGVNGIDGPREDYLRTGLNRVDVVLRALR